MSHRKIRTKGFDEAVRPVVETAKLLGYPPGLVVHARETAKRHFNGVAGDRRCMFLTVLWKLYNDWHFKDKATFGREFNMHVDSIRRYARMFEERSGGYECPREVALGSS